MTARFRRSARSTDIWPGFVDALSTLLLVLIFLLAVFVVAEFFLGRVLSGREDELAGLKNTIVELEGMLSIERLETQGLRDEASALSAELFAANRDREELRAGRGALERALAAMTGDRDARAGEAADAAELRLRLAETRAALAAARADLAAVTGEADDSAAALDDERRLSDEARRQIGLLNRQVGALRAQLSAIQEALDAREAALAERDVQIADLSGRLNLALADQVQELRQARSAFFGRLREILAGRGDVRIDGDRFVIQSGVLFETASDELGAEGLRQIGDLAATLLDISADLPADMDWVLRIDGHTDKRPISTARFQSNWALSAARAITVARTLIARGVPPRRLMAAGFGEFQPIDDAENEEAYRRNRRIELKLTQR